jgi:hypothetical protein
MAETRAEHRNEIGLDRMRRDAKSFKRSRDGKKAPQKYEEFEDGRQYEPK